MAARLMRPMAFTSGCLAVLIASLCAALSGSARAAGPEIGTDAQRESGRKLYAKNCSQCHGEKGDGEGYATPHLYPRPRNFTTGKFKIRTTPNGALPTHQDLVNIIKRGMPYTSMPAWPNLSDEELSESRLLHHDLLAGVLRRREMPRNPFRSRARRQPRRSPSSSGGSCSRRTAA